MPAVRFSRLISAYLASVRTQCSAAETRAIVDRWWRRYQRRPSGVELAFERHTGPRQRLTSARRFTKRASRGSFFENTSAKKHAVLSSERTKPVKRRALALTHSSRAHFVDPPRLPFHSFSQDYTCLRAPLKITARQRGRERICTTHCNENKQVNAATRPTARESRSRQERSLLHHSHTQMRTQTSLQLRHNATNGEGAYITLSGTEARSWARLRTGASMAVMFGAHTQTTIAQGESRRRPFHHHANAGVPVR